MQSLIRAIYPAQCVACDTPTAEEHGLCGSCWGQTHFVQGLACGKCGVPLPGEGDADDALCDDCLRIARPWDKGRAAMLYSGVGRRLILGLKHGDRTDLVPAMGRWLASATQGLASPETLIVPVPLHWSRLLKRRYNQAALLANALSKFTGVPCCPDALVRTKRTKPLEGHAREARFAALADAISPRARRVPLISAHNVLLVDDVMTSGATFAAATEACRAAGAQQVCVLALARVAKDP